MAARLIESERAKQQGFESGSQPETTGSGGDGVSLKRGGPGYKIEADTDSDNSSVDENFDVASITESIDEQLTWRGRMQSGLHNNWFHLTIIIFVCLDALIVIFELLLDVGAFSNVRCEGENFLEQAERCHYQRLTGITCAPPALLVIEKANISEAALSQICRCGFRTGRRVCIPTAEATGVNPALVLHVISIIILCIFMLEVIVKLIAFRMKYFTHKFEVLDGIVVVISWVLDIASLAREEAFEAAALLIVLRLWRVVRIVNGAVLSAKAQSDNQLEEARKQARKIVHAFHKCQDRMDDMEEENIGLKRRIGHGGYEKLQKPKVGFFEDDDEHTSC